MTIRVSGNTSSMGLKFQLKSGAKYPPVGYITIRMRIAQQRFRLCRHCFVNILFLGSVHANERFDCLDHPLGVSPKIAVDLL